MKKKRECCLNIESRARFSASTFTQQRVHSTLFNDIPRCLRRRRGIWSASSRTWFNISGTEPTSRAFLLGRVWSRRRRGSYREEKREKENHQGTGRVRRSSKLSLSFDAESKRVSQWSGGRIPACINSLSFFFFFFYGRLLLPLPLSLDVFLVRYAESASATRVRVCNVELSLPGIWNLHSLSLFCSHGRPFRRNQRGKEKKKRRELNDQKISLPFFDSTAMLAVVQASGVASPSGATGS